MKEKLFFSSIKYIIILFFLLIKITNTKLNFYYPTAITLYDGNIFIIHRTGITICDSSFSKIIRYVQNFTSDIEQISTEEKLSKVSISKFNDGYFVSIIINKVYIFDKFGYMKDCKNLEYAYNNLYFSLTAYKYDIDYYYFLVGFIYQQSLYLFYYKYDLSISKIIEVAKILGFNEVDVYNNIINIQNKGLSCQFLKNNNNEDLILCLFSVCLNLKQELDYGAFLIRSNSIIVNAIEYDFYDYSIECIKSFSNYDHSKALYCYYLYNNEVECQILSFISSNFSYNYNEASLGKIYGLVGIF